MFGNKNSAVPYVRIGGVDRQSVLTSNANGNTPVKEIGVNANGNLIFSTDLTTFKSVLDLKYSQFKSNDENQEDTWETEKSVSMKATDGTSTTQLIVSPTGAKLTGALRIAKGTGNGIQDYDGNPMLYIDNYDDLYIRNDSGTEIHLGTNRGEHIQIGGHKVLSDTNVVGHSFTFNDKSVAVTSDIPKTLNNKALVANGNTTIYGTDITLSSDNTSNVADAINNANTRIDNLTTTVNGKADISAIPTKTSQLTNDSNFATTSQIPDISGKANLSGGNTFSGTQTFNNGITLANDTAITNASGNNVITTQTGGHTILGDPNGTINIQGSSVRPLYTQNGSDSQTLALYKDIPKYFTTAGATGGNTSGGLKLTAGHLYRIYVGNGDAQLVCLVKMPKPMVEQYWFMGMNLYNHYCRLHISSAGIVTYQYANVGQTNWANNNSVYINYEDITSKS